MKADNRRPAVFFRPYHCVSNERQWRGGFGLPVSFVTGLPTPPFAVHPVWKRVVRFNTDKEAIMVKCTTTPVVPTPAITDDIQDLKRTIFDMDSLSQGGFSKISSIARLALAALEAPDHARMDEDVAIALATIWQIADDVENCINSSAEAAGANYSDEKLRRRRAARASTSSANGGRKVGEQNTAEVQS